MLAENWGQRAIDERRLATARDTRHANELAKREGDINILEVVASAPSDGEELA